LIDEGQYKRRNGARIAPYRLIAENFQKSAFLVKISENDGIVVGISVHMRVSGQIGFGHTHFDSNLLVDSLDGKEVFGDRALIVGIVPLPATLPALDEDTAVTDSEPIDEFKRQMFVEDEDICEVFITEEVVDFPQFTMCAGYKLASLNQFQ
jgi:hypothetical protein